jgi:dUTP pyrophosphatase
VVPVGITVADITPGFGFVLRPKSGLGFKAGLQPHLGEIDNGYRGDCAVKMYNFSSKDYTFKKGDKVAQIKIEKIYDTSVEWTGKLVEAERGDAGFGSSGK